MDPRVKATDMARTGAGRGPRFDLDYLLGGVRSVSGWTYLEGFLAAAVAAVLIIRSFLGITGFPKIGGHGLHIAHLLWGGAFMLAAMVLLLTILGHRVKHGAAILGGIGFGTFIDELGKFITSDNNYFFKPAIALIYVIFVVLFLLFRQIENWSELSSDALLANAAEVVVSGLSGGATRSEIRQGLALLDRSGASGATAEGIRQALVSLSYQPESRSLFSRIEDFARHLFDWLVAHRGFARAILFLFLAHATVFAVVAFALSFQIGLLDLLRDTDRSVSATGDLLTSLISSACIIVGALRWHWSRLAAYRWFKRGILVSILLAQVFLFYASQLAALGGLAIDLFLLLALNQLIREALYPRQAQWTVNSSPRMPAPPSH